MLKGEYWGEMGFIRVAKGNNALLLEQQCAWATPLAFTTRNTPCYEDGSNCVRGGQLQVASASGLDSTLPHLHSVGLGAPAVAHEFMNPRPSSIAAGCANFRVMNEPAGPSIQARTS